MVLSESCLMTVVGGSLGLGLGWMIISRGDPTGGLLPMFTLPVHHLLTGFGLAVALGVVSGILPALHAMSLRVAEALRRT
jgi:putative ABC transport system permease protein